MAFLYKKMILSSKKISKVEIFFLEIIISVFKAIVNKVINKQLVNNIKSDKKK